MTEFVTLIEWVEVQCPYCGEHYETQVDLSAGSQRYIEDCQICCAPLECTLKVDDFGALEYLHVARQDE